MPFRGIPYWMMSEQVKAETQRRISESRMGSKNWLWRGDNVGYSSLHEWIKNRKPKPKLCERCHIKPPFDLTNKSGEYKRDLSDWEWLCRRCHMEIDGRMENLHCSRRKPLPKCPKCGSRTVKDGRRPIRRKGIDAKEQAYICVACEHQFCDKSDVIAGSLENKDI